MVFYVPSVITTIFLMNEAYCEVIDIKSVKSQKLFFNFNLYPSGTITIGIETTFDTAQATETHKFGVRSES